MHKKQTAPTKPLIRFYVVCLEVPKIQAVVYLTRSVHQEENEVVVEKALEFVNMVQIQKKMPWKVIPPVIPFLGDDITNQKGIIGKYIKFPPSSMTNGCFLVAIAREVSTSFFLSFCQLQ